MTGQFKRLDIEFETLQATDWRDLAKHDYDNVDREARDKEGRRPLSPGMIACHLSHRRAIATVASGQHDLTAILEDDVTLAPNIANVLQSLQRAYSLGVNFDIVFLHRIKTYRQYTVLRSIDDNVKLGVTKYSDRGALAYLISKNAAVQLLKRYPRVVHQLDHTLHAYWETGLSVFSLEHPVVMHGNEAGRHSFLQESVGEKRSWSVQRLPRRFRSILREEILKRRFFRRKLDHAANAT